VIGYKEILVNNLSPHPPFQLPTTVLALLSVLPFLYKMNTFSALFSTFVIAAVAQAALTPNHAVRKLPLLPYLIDSYS
jgi:hypothetical protein